MTPFNLPTVDGVELYLWHILPLALYTQHEATFSAAPRVALDAYASSDAFRLLKEDPEARLIISCELPSTLTHLFPLRLTHLSASNTLKSTATPAT